MHEIALPLLAGLVLLALMFDFLNGLHDAANSIATVVATKLLRPVQAVAFAAFFNFAAYFLTLAWPELHKVADTIGKGLIDKDMVSPAVVFAALGGAMFWNIVTWLKGIPSSSSHALVGGIVGAGVAAAGFGTIQWNGVTKTLMFIPLAPLIGMTVAMLVMLGSSWLASWASARGAERMFKGCHLVSAAGYSLGHGLNDAQKTMGIITVLLIFDRLSQRRFPRSALGRDQLLHRHGAGDDDGRLEDHRDDGQPDHQARQHQGFAASTGGSIMLFGASLAGIPVSTTHTITGAVIGAGVARRASAVRWGVAQSVVTAWVITIPCSAAVAAMFYALTRLFV